MQHMPAGIIEEHISTIMLLLNNKEDDLVQKLCLDVVTKLSPMKLVELNLKPQIAAIFEKSPSRSWREQLAKLLRTIPDSTKA